MSETKAKTILLVDDDVDYLLSTQTRLKAAGYEVETADGVAAAKEQLERRHPDAAIIDLMMEETDGGFGLCYHIKKHSPGVPVIMVSAVTAETGLDFDASTDEERAWIKADAFLAKPIRFEQLQRELNRLLQE
ncbi:MAG: response regulator [Phycisphaerae bacterium]|nr:response regulator [Phycisphaerae bacterium]